MSRDRWLLLAILALGGVLRVALYTGLAVGDDTFYHMQAIAHALGGTWPPEPYHWHTRLGLTLPTAALIRLAGLQPWVFVAVPFAASMAGIYVAYRIAREFVSPRAALLAAGFAACYPLELIYATHLFPDVPVGLMQTLGLWFWIRGLRTDRTSLFALAGLSIAVGYLFRETVVMAGPVFLCLWIYFGRWRRPAVLATVAVALAVVVAETAMYWLTTGDPQYRLAAVAAQQVKPANLELVSRGTAGGGYWTDPLLMLATNQEFGVFQLAAALLLFPAWRHAGLRPLVLWWLATFLWTFYGPTSPTSFVTLMRDPRYAAALTAPTVIIIAHFVDALPRVSRTAAATALCATGVLSASLDQGTTLIDPHLSFARSAMATADTAMDPVEYYGARWQVGLDTPVPFKCASSLGREALVRLFAHLPHTECVAADTARFVVIEDGRRPDLRPALTEGGWTEVATFGAPASAGRRLAASILRPLPGQRARSAKIGSTPALFVFENPDLKK